MTTEYLMKGEKVTKKFGGLIAVDNVDFAIEKNTILGLIGPNGSGKTTLLNLVCGLLDLTSGMIEFMGRDITELKPHKRCVLGIAKTNQILRPFTNCSALENATIGALYGRPQKLTVSEAKEEAFRWLEFVGLSDEANTVARDLSQAQLRMLEIARALATNPKLILLDEPLSGLNPVETDEGLETIFRIRKEVNITILWIEHVMRALLKGAERVMVLNYGKKIFEGTPREVACNKDVITAYLGRTPYA
jgi:branched-chain amino acid transport system ATP-binding protein